MRFLDAIKRPGGNESRFGLTELYQNYMTFQGGQYPLGYTTTYGNQKAEPIVDSFGGFVAGGLQGNGIISAVEQVRFKVFSEARFQFQQLRQGRPGDLFGTPALTLLEKPYPGGTTGDLLSRMLLDADLAGNSYHVVLGDELVRLRPDWVEIALEPRMVPGVGYDENDTMQVGNSRAGYFYYEGGKVPGKRPAFFFPNEVAHFAPYPDPSATYRGMSWLTPVVREIQADGLMTKHRVKFFENSATPNLAVSLPGVTTPEAFDAWVARMDAEHKGVDNAYKTLYTGDGADVTVIGANMQQLDFKSTQGAGETRIAAAGRVPAVLVGLSEGLAGSSLNQGNYQSAKRAFADGEMRAMWRNACASLEPLITLPNTSTRLWYDDRDVAFLRDDQKDEAEIGTAHALTIKTYTDAGFTADSAVAAVSTGDLSLLKHSGLFSVQLQPPGTTAAPAAPAPTPGKGDK